MNTKSMKKHLEASGLEFKKEDGEWVCYLESDVVTRDRFLGDLIWKAAKAIGETK